MLRFAVLPLFTIQMLLAGNGLLQAQIPLYESQFPTEVYAEFLAKEIEALAETDEVVRGHAFLNLGKNVLSLSEELSISYKEKALALGQKTGEDSLSFIAKTFLAIPHINRGEYQSAESYLNPALAYWEKQNDLPKIALTSLHYGYLENQRGNISESLKHFFRAKSIQEKYLEPYEMWDVYNRLLSAYSGMGDYESALQYGEEFIQSARQTSNPPRSLALILYNTSVACLRLGQHETAATHAREALEHYGKSKRPKFKVHLYSLITEISVASGNLAAGVSAADSTIKYAQQFEQPLMLAEAFQNLANIADLQHDQENSLAYLDQAMHYAKQSNSSKIVMAVAESFHEMYQKSGDFANAYQHLLLSDSLYKAIFQEDLSHQVRDQEKKAITDKSSREIELLNAQNNLKEENLAREKRLRIILIAGLILLLAFVASILKLLQQRSNHNKELSEKNATISTALAENKMLLKEVHHRVKNNLQIVASLLNLQSKYLQDDSAISAIKTSKARVQSISLLHQELYGEGDFAQVRAQDYFDKLVRNIFSTHKTEQENVAFTTDIDDLAVDIDVMMSLGLIANELICNALKHAFQDRQDGQIILSLKRQDAFLYLRVSDNGKGIGYTKLPESSSSLGIQLIRAFTKKLRAQLEINNLNGTSYTFRIPHKEQQLAS